MQTEKLVDCSHYNNGNLCNWNVYQPLIDACCLNKCCWLGLFSCNLKLFELLRHYFQFLCTLIRSFKISRLQQVIRNLNLLMIDIEQVFSSVLNNDLTKLTIWLHPETNLINDAFNKYQELLGVRVSYFLKLPTW